MNGGWQCRCGLLCMVAMLGACSDADLEGLDKQLTALADQPPPAPRRLTAISRALPENYGYRQAAGRSPFRADEESRSITLSPMGLSTIVLSQYSLDQLELQGILARGDRHWALVASPDGELHRLGLARRLGRDAWKVVAIGSRSMTLVARASTGEQVTRQQVMRLGASRPDG